MRHGHHCHETASPCSLLPGRLGSSLLQLSPLCSVVFAKCLTHFLPSGGVCRDIERPTLDRIVPFEEATSPCLDPCDDINAHLRFGAVFEQLVFLLVIQNVLTVGLITGVVITQASTAQEDIQIGCADVVLSSRFLAPGSFGPRITGWPGTALFLDLSRLVRAFLDSARSPFPHSNKSPFQLLGKWGLLR